MNGRCDIAEKGNKPPLNILIVEDVPLVAWLIEDALIFSGLFSSGIADRMSAALSLIDHHRPDLALCDIKLADGESGLAVAEELAQRGIPCVFVSASPPARVRHRLIKGWVKKPFCVATIGEAAVAAYRRANGRRIHTVPVGMTLF